MTTFVPSPSTRFLSTEDGALLLNLDTDAYYALNRTGLEAWKILSTGRRLEVVAEVLTGSFDVSRGEALGCLRRFTAELLKESLLVERNESEPTGGRENGQ